MDALASGEAPDVARYPLPDGVEDGVLNRAQLAVAFGVSEPTITKWLSQGMPVKSTGTNGSAYEFLLSECWAWREARSDAARARKAAGDALAQQAALAFRNLDDDQEGEEKTLTAREVTEWAEAEYRRNRVAEQRGDLVRADRVQRLMEGVLNQVRTAIYTLPDWTEREFGLSAADVDKMQSRCDEVLIQMQADIRRELLPGGAGQVTTLGDQAALDI